MGIGLNKDGLRDPIAYARAALDAECDELATTGRGRNEAVNRCGFNLGGFIPGGYLGRAEVESRIMAAAEASGYIGKDGPAAARASMRSGIEGGMKQPRDLGQGETPRATVHVLRPKPQLGNVDLPDWTEPDPETGKPKFGSAGRDQPFRFDDEVRRHPYRRDGVMVRVKCKSTSDKFVDWYKVKRPSDGVVGWQARKPEGFVPCPYVPPGAPDPFDPERRGEMLVWAEGEKDADAARANGFHAFTFGSASDIPDVSELLHDHAVIIVVDNDEAGRKSIPKKVRAAIAAGPRSLKLVQFLDMEDGFDCADFFAKDHGAEDFLDRAERIDPETWGRSETPETSKSATQEASGCATLDGVTEDSAALMFEQRHAGGLLFDHTAGSWFVWTGAQWKRELTGLAFEWARKVARDIASGTARAATKATAGKSSFATGVERFSRSTRAFATTANGWDRDLFLLGTPGGVIDLRNGKLRDADPADRITKLAAVTPAARSECPQWIKFLHEATKQDTSLIRFLQQMSGYALTGDTREHALFFVHGDGGNGKGVFINTITKILGEYATAAAMDTFTAGYGSRHPTELASLHGARLVTASETEEGRAWAEARIKSLTGGDRIAARFMRQDFFEFDPRFKLIIIGNHRPTLANVDEALRRRMNFIPFTNKPKVKDRELEAKLQKEWPGILRWMIDGCLDWQANGLVRPDVVQSATDSYFGDQDLLGQWLDECCNVEPGNLSKWDRSSDLFASWRAYAENAGEREGSAKSLSEALQKRGFVKSKGTGGVRIFRGLRLRMAQQHPSSA